MRVVQCALFAVLLVGTTAQATESLGTEEEGLQLAEQIIQIIDRDGIDAAVSALASPDLPFSSTRQGVNLFNGSTVVGDNREPEMVYQDYAEISDLTGALAWPKIAEGAANKGEVVLKWYHYETQGVYDFTCITRSAKDPSYSVMICR